MDFIEHTSTNYVIVSLLGIQLQVSFGTPTFIVKFLSSKKSKLFSLCDLDLFDINGVKVNKSAITSNRFIPR